MAVRFSDIPETAAQPIRFSDIQGGPVRFSDVPDTPATGFLETIKEEFTGEELARKIPVVGGVVGIVGAVKVSRAADRINSNFKYGGTKFGREEDEKLIADEIERQTQELTFGGKVAKGISALPTFMIEFALSGGLAAMGSKAAKKAGTKLIGKYAASKAGKAALATAGITAGGLVRASTLLTPRVGEKAAERQMLANIELKDPETWATSLAKAWGDTVIEAASEETGGLITKGLGKAASTLISKLPKGQQFVTKLGESWVKLTGGTQNEFLKKISTKVGYSNMIGEMGEERIGTILREVTGVSDREGNMIERVVEGLREDFQLENVGVEAITLVVPGAARTIASRILNATPEEAIDEEGNITFEEPVEEEPVAPTTLEEIPEKVEVPKKTAQEVADEAIKEPEPLQIAKERAIKTLVDAGRTEISARKTVEGIKTDKQLKNVMSLVEAEGGAKIEAVKEPITQEVKKKTEPRPPEQTTTDRTPAIQKDVADAAVVDVTDPAFPTSTKRDSTKEIRERLGLAKVNSKERRSDEQALAEAIKRKIPQKAGRIANEINAGGTERVLSDIEDAGMRVAVAELEIEHEQLMDLIGKEKDDATTKTLSVEAERVENELSSLLNALEVSGSEAGRALRARKVQIGRDFKLTSVLNRAKSAAGKKISKTKRLIFEGLTKRLDVATKKIVTLEKEVRELQAKKLIRRGAKRFTTLKTQQRRQTIADLASDVNTLLEAGCNN